MGRASHKEKGGREGGKEAKEAIVGHDGSFFFFLEPKLTEKNLSFRFI